jgi:lactoylglutathione lyase
MSVATGAEANVQQAVPFFGVTDMERSLAFYRDGLGFAMKLKWVPDGQVRWCWLELGGAAIMLQEYKPEFRPQGKLGEGVSVCFMCRDALAIYREARTRGLNPSRPMVGNTLWVTSFTDPDGYRIDFESPTDLPEETEYSEELHG